MAVSGASGGRPSRAFFCFTTGSLSLRITKSQERFQGAQVREPDPLQPPATLPPVDTVSLGRRWQRHRLDLALADVGLDVAVRDAGAQGGLVVGEQGIFAPRLPLR